MVLSLEVVSLQLYSNILLKEMRELASEEERSGWGQRETAILGLQKRGIQVALCIPTSQIDLGQTERCDCDDASHDVVGNDVFGLRASAPPTHS